MGFKSDKTDLIWAQKPLEKKLARDSLQYFP